MIGFKEFAASAYQRGDVASRCIEWQDRFGADVLIVLFCCWRADHGAETGESLLRRAAAATRIMEHHLLQPLRAARRALQAVQTHNPALRRCREAVLERELQCEWLKADVLAGLATDSATPEAGASSVMIATRALTCYLRLIGEVDANVKREADHMARAVFGASVCD